MRRRVDTLVNGANGVAANGASVVPLRVQAPPEPVAEDDQGYDERASGAEDDEDVPFIEVTSDESHVADQAIEALRREEMLFQRGGQLVRIVVDETPDKVLLRAPRTPRIVPATAANIREALSRQASFYIGEREVHPPDWLVRAILDRGSWPGLRRLRAVVDAPLLRADGTVADAPGHDEATEVFLCPSTAHRLLASEPTRDDSVRAAQELLEVFHDFPFETNAHRAAAVAAVLTPFARHAFDAPVPLFAIDKNVRAAGGTLLADAIGVIATGRPMPRMVAAKDAEEERKRITSIALAGDAIVLIDNVAGTLGTDALDAALTGTTWSDRLLSTNTRATLPLLVTWYATGNNVEFGADTLRRVCHIRLNVRDENPEKRTGFKHPKLLAWVRRERPRLVSAALTILRAYCAAGRPNMGVRPWGSFEEWVALVGSAVAWVGLGDPGETREELVATADSERNALSDLLTGWRELFGDAGSTAAAALLHLKKTDEEFIDRGLTLKSALAEVCPGKPGTLPTARALGALLKRARGRVVGGLALEIRGAKGKAGVVWVAREVTQVTEVTHTTLAPVNGEKSQIGERRETESPESPESPVAPPPPRRRRSEVQP